MMQPTLNESETRFRVLIERGWEAVTLVDGTGRVLYASPSSTRVWGYPVEELGAHSAFDYVHPDDLPGVLVQFQRLLGEPGSTEQAIYRVRHQDGSWRWTESTATNLLEEPSVAAVVIHSHDITPRKEAQEALRLVTSQAPCLLFYAEIVEVDEDLRWSIRVADEVAAQQVLPLEPAPGRDYVEAWMASRKPEDGERIRRASIDAVCSGKTHYQEEYRCVTRTGEERWYSEAVHLSPLEPHRWRAVGVCTDVTERKRMEEALRQQTEALAAADHRKDQFLAMLAHELRNPLAAIAGASYLLERMPGADAEARRLQALINRQTRHLTRLLEDLLDVSRIMHSKVSLQREHLDFREIIHRAVESSGVLAHRAGHRLSLSTPPEPLWVWGDTARLEQILTNLLNNAKKYTPPGGEISLWAGHVGDSVVLRISDTGIGIPPELLPQIFDLFTQAEQALDRAQGGLGLGLTLVRTLVEMHGGTVTAESAGVGQGSTFTVSLPAAPELSRPASQPTTPVAARPCRILVIEDSPDAAETLQDILELAGHEVRIAHNGSDGVLRAKSWGPDVVLCDIGLPGLDGYGVAEQLRADPQTHETFLIALTGFGQESDRQRALSAGFDLHLTKPVDMAVLQQTIAGGRGAGGSARP